MIVLETTQPVPLTLTKEGTIRVTGSRVSLDTIVHQYQQGASAEQIQESFPSLALADIYGVLSYYLHHRQTVDAYLQQQDATAETIRQRIESDPQYQARRAQMRQQIRQRWHRQQSDA
jgi:uncharacterized protein (DUF433 family)